MISPGNVIRVPSGSRIGANVNALRSRSRKDRVVVAEYVFDDALTFVDGRGKRHAAALADVELVSSDDHRLTVTRRNLGGHPIAGWNWPLWGYDYRCVCGVELGDREDHAIHVEDVGELTEAAEPARRRFVEGGGRS